MIKWMVIVVDNVGGGADATVWVDGLSNIQTAEAERTMFLEDHPEVSADNVTVVQYRE